MPDATQPGCLQGQIGRRNINSHAADHDRHELVLAKPQAEIIHTLHHCPYGNQPNNPSPIGQGWDFTPLWETMRDQPGINQVCSSRLSLNLPLRSYFSPPVHHVFTHPPAVARRLPPLLRPRLPCRHALPHRLGADVQRQPAGPERAVHIGSMACP
ncbi:hypothetical protein SDC9_132788 [bioreactor metagenome]|uniref:Uncharacterized protein n=1 Tax=bioreactor metagenome TaxID=1076179 RepID=A0A645D926_9ZZZZ